MASLDLQRRGEWRPLPDPKRQRPSAETSRAAVALELEAVEDLPKRTGKNILPGIPLQHSGVSDLLAFAFLDDAGAPSTVNVPEARASNSSDERPPSNSSGHGDSPLTKSASDSSVNSATAVDVSEGKSLGMVSPQPSNISLSSLDRTEPSVDASPVKPAVLSPIFGSPSGLGSPLIAPSSSSFSRRDKGEALVHAALGSLAYGVHRDAADCGFMEDETAVLRREDARGHPSVALFGVFDGHGGASAVRYLKRELLESIVRNLGCTGAVGEAFDDDHARAALAGGFGACERALLTSRCASGSTAAVLMLQSGGRSLNMAWLGDCRAVLCRAGAAIPLTADHTPANEEEVARVASEGGKIVEGRLAECLQVTRAFGDVEPCASSRSASSDAPAAAAGASSASSSGDSTSSTASTAPQRTKVVGLSAQPQCASQALTTEDEFVVLASDGLWDVLSSEEAVRITRSELRAYDDAQMAAEKLIEVALARHTEDNVTALVVSLFAPKPEESVARHMGKRIGRPNSFVQLNTPHNFVQVIGGFDS